MGFISRAITIPPLLLISLVENIFKYGELGDPLNPAVISINEIDGLLQFRSENVIQKRNNVMGHGVGLENTQLRLNNIFPGKHSLTITETGNTYSVHLDIQMAHASELYAESLI